MISACAAVAVGAVSIYVGVRNLNGLSLQQQKYVEESFSRYQGSSSLAWRTIGEANNRPFELGQSAALWYLAVTGKLRGNVTANGTSLTIYDAAVPDGDKKPSAILFFDLGQSSLCKTKINITPGKSQNLVVDLTYSLLKHSYFAGSMTRGDFLAADLEHAVFDSVTASNTRFAAADLRHVIMHGGRFNSSDFRGTDLRDAQTDRGYIGVGSEPSEGIYGSGFVVNGYVEGDAAPSWPLLFSKDISVNEALGKVGRESGEAERNYLVDFTDARFSWADLRGAHLENSNITKKQVNEACTDATTILPVGIKPGNSENCLFPESIVETSRSLRSLTHANAVLDNSCKASLGEINSLK